jgi:hypothetical protein
VPVVGTTQARIVSDACISDGNDAAAALRGAAAAQRATTAMMENSGRMT